MTNNPLDRVSIASPCSANWDQMQGNDQRRHCAQCNLHVHNLSGMSTTQAIRLLQQAGQGRLCVRYFRRADGTVLTRDCPVGLRQKLRRAWARAAALWLALWGATTACTKTPPTPDDHAFMGEAVEPAELLPTPHPHMGAVALPPVLPAPDKK